VLVFCGATPLLYFWRTQWVHAALFGYLPTGLLFGVLLVGEYPPIGTSWFWKSIIPITAGHSAITFGLVLLSWDVPYVNRWPRALYGLASIMLAVEYYLSSSLIEALDPDKSKK
jgi:hypothetical protein